MKHLKEWLERLRQRAQRSLNSTHYGQQEALEVLASCDEHSDWLQLSRHWNGFIREIAVRVLNEQPSPQALVALVERLNDWVPQIRELAEQGVQPYLQPSQADALLHALGPLLALASKGRCDHRAILARLAEVLALAEVHPALEAALAGRQGKAARFLFGLLLENTTDKLPALLQLGMNHRDPSLGRLALAASRRLPLLQARTLLRQGHDSASAARRVIALREWLAREGEEPQQLQALLRQALLDPAPAPRCLAIWAAARHEVDARQVLLHALESMPSDKRGWLGLIGLTHELREPAAMPALQLALQHSAPAVRIAAMETLAVVAPEAVLPSLLGALDDPSRKVARCATQLLRNLPLAADDERLHTVMAEALRTGKSDKVATLAALSPLWVHLQQLLRALSLSGDAAQQEPLQAALNMWRQRRRRAYSLQPTAQQQRALRDELAALRATGKLPVGEPIHWLD